MERHDGESGHLRGIHEAIFEHAARSLRAIGREGDVLSVADIAQDLSTLENPAIIEQLRGDENAASAPAAQKKPAATTKPAVKRQAAKARKVPKANKAPARKPVAKKAKKAAPKKPAPNKRGNAKKSAPKKKKAAARRRK